MSEARGFQGAVLKALGAKDYRLTVTDRHELSEHYVRLSFTGGGLLTQHAVHPTMWIRMWFPAGGNRVHQRGYTLVDPDPSADRFDIEFTLHDGAAADWARKAQPGDAIAATVMGTKFALPEPKPAGYLIVGDTASLAATNSLLSVIGDVPARVWLEWVHEDDRTLPIVSGDTIAVQWVRREHAGRALTEAVRSSVNDATDHFGFVACDDRTTRAVVDVLRNDFHLPRRSVKAQAYWRA